MNIILLFIETIITSIALIYLYKKEKYDGIYLWILLFTMFIGIISQKTTEIFGLEINLGFITNALIFIASNILIQKKGPEESKKIISTIFIGNVIIFIFSIISILFTSSTINEITNTSFNKIFYLNNRIYVSSLISLIISIWINAKLYHQIRQIKNKIIISNVLSTIIIHFIESILFCVLSYTFKLPIINIIELIVIRYVFKVTIGLIGTNIIYMINSFER